jgi:SAM-dependent methyltransferase
MSHQRIKDDVGAYYTGKVREHGTTARGVDWPTEASQRLRFGELLRVCAPDASSLVDVGCGYGALVDQLPPGVAYQGFDLSEEMVARGRELHPGITFTTDRAALVPAEYAVASGIFNVRMTHADDAWREYILAGLDDLDSLGTRGFAFNMLTSYSDADKMRADLYYGDPCFFFDHCKRAYSKNVALLHDYGLYEFTMLVRK